MIKLQVLQYIVDELGLRKMDRLVSAGLVTCLVYFYSQEIRYVALVCDAYHSFVGLRTTLWSVIKVAQCGHTIVFGDLTICIIVFGDLTSVSSCTTVVQFI